MNKSLENKVAVIGGGAKNLGGLISRDLAKHGIRAVAIHDNSDGAKANAEETAAAVRTAGAEAISVQGDLTKPENNKLLFDTAEDAFGKADIAINTTA
jgi:NAD(P)-dependent dehydrogenase (short-subunit alcohol dehydrogenase family)